MHPFQDGSATVAKFNRPRGICIGQAGNIFVADLDNERIRMITPDGTASTFAGTIYGFNDGNGINAQFHRPLGICADSSGNLYVSQISNIRKITPTADVSTIAGNTGEGSGDGDALSAQFLAPGGIVIDNMGTIYVSDTENHRIRKISGLLSVNEFINSYLSFTIYPNPTNSILNIDLEFLNSSSQIIISDITGKIIISQMIENHFTTIDVSKYKKGFYFATLYTEDKKNIKKFIIN